MRDPQTLSREVVSTCATLLQERLSFTREKLDEVTVNDGVAMLFNSEPIRFIHTAKHGKPQDQVMAELKRDIDQQTGSLKNPSNWIPPLAAAGEGAAGESNTKDELGHCDLCVSSITVTVTRNADADADASAFASAFLPVLHFSFSSSGLDDDSCSLKRIPGAQEDVRGPH